MGTMINPEAFDQWGAVAAAQARGSSAVENGCMVTFYTRPKVQDRQSEIDGVVVVTDRLYCRVITPHDNKTRIDRPSNKADPGKYPAAWAAYQKGIEGMANGTQLSAMTWVTPAQQAVLKFLEVTTVEQLAELGPANRKRVGQGAVALVAKAKQALEGDDAAFQELRGENVELRDTLAAMSGRLQALEGGMQAGPEQPEPVQAPVPAPVAAEAPKRRPAGRPKRAAAA